LINDLPESDTVLLRRFKELRLNLSGDDEAIEVKTQGKGIISWATRGQMGIGGKMIATTGFQRGGYDKEELVELFKNIFKNEDKYVEFTRKSLRSAKDVFKKGGHVTSELRDQVFRLFFDNRRKIIANANANENENSIDLSSTLLDSAPLNNVDQCRTFRFLAKFPLIVPFNRTNRNKTNTKYNSSIEVAVRNFIKAYYSKNEKFGLLGTEFKCTRDLIAFISGAKSTKGVKISRHSISKLKNRRLF
jgi:hypothetical protein